MSVDSGIEATPTHFRPVQACLTITNSPKSLKICTAPTGLASESSATRVRAQGKGEPGGEDTRQGTARTQEALTRYGVWIDGFPAVRLTNFILNA